MIPDRGGADGARPRLLLIESRGRLADAEAGLRRDAAAQARAGYSVLLFLIEDGVMLTLAGSDAALDAFQEAGGELAADRFSLAQRGLAGARLRPGLRVMEADGLAQLLLDPEVQAVWH
ncbi:hypothetical protein AB0D04_19465 [Streptomyces sp. NPDC048483]|uniref:hypothetical protein n=1 Tax=Streptomyces sp. NPDC048483 TaxID=3154927 RepID=UPI0034369084